MRAGAGNIEAGLVEELMQQRLMDMLMIAVATTLWMAAGWQLFQALMSTILWLAQLPPPEGVETQALPWRIAGALLSSALLVMAGYLSWRFGNRER